MIRILKKAGAILNGHFVGTSGRHLDTYINKDALYANTLETSKIGLLFAKKNKDLNIDIVIAPALGGIVLSQWTAYHLSKLKKKNILAVYTEKDQNNNQVLKRGYDKLIKGKNVLVVEDVTTTGQSVKKLMRVVKSAGGKIKAVCVMLNRDLDRVNRRTMGVSFSALATLQVKSYSPKNCPMCKNRMSIDTQVGHGKKLVV